MPKIKEEVYLDYKELAEFSKREIRTLRNWKSQGKLTYTKLNGKVLFPKTEILKDLKRNQVRSVDSLLDEIAEGRKIHAC